MHLTRLRIVGFKTFVEPTEFRIEPGLTGIVGPNGCGKSNLVEALRWVMGESSHKNMRASGMDDVIFSGSGSRPGRSHAEVMLRLDNSERRAPAAFNDDDAIEVSRRIVRESGSTYRVNGREVRARDVQLLFADAATGARSPAMVRQGQVSELIAAKPQARRRILEDAAGIAGLHARRHEAELRLKAAEENLVRVEDVLGALETQLDSLRRQARGAQRYRAVSAEIRRLEATMLLIQHGAARREAAAAERGVETALAEVAARGDVQTRAATDQAVAAAAIPALREAEAAVAGELQHLVHAGAALDAEERRAKERLGELGRQIAEGERDLSRESEARADAQASLARLAGEGAALPGDETEGTARDDLEGDLAAAEAQASVAEAALASMQTAQAEAQARAGALAASLRDETARSARLGDEQARTEREAAALAQSAAADLGPLRAAAEAAVRAAEAAEAGAPEARARLAAASEAEAAGRRPLAEAERTASRLETEIRTLAKLLLPPTGAHHPRVLDAITVAAGYEAALAAALGDDLDAASDPAAPAHWRDTGAGEGDPPLPEGAEPLAAHVTAPAALTRRLRQVGVVERAAGATLRTTLAPGQRLVSREGDLWRWDGLTLAAEAPGAAARRFAERNRLGSLAREAEAARAGLDDLRRRANALQEAVRTAAQAETRAIEEARRARAAQDAAREALIAAERRDAALAGRLTALADAAARLARDLEEAEGRRRAAEAALAALPDVAGLATAASAARQEAESARATVAGARAALAAHDQAREAHRRERERVAAERERWSARAERAAAAVADLAARLERARDERTALAEAPETFHVERRRILGQRGEAEAARRTAADRLAAGERILAEGDRAARAALDALAAAREARAAAQAAYEGLARRVAEIERGIAEALDTDPAGLWPLADLPPGALLPEASACEPRLAALRADRERLGAVNLRADEELAQADTRRGALAAEREDLAEAIRRLRGAIGSLNREGRERLLAAFTAVNAHFERLFTTLFSGGTAELTLVDSDDPLEAGLEILARPPGKKPQTMTLLSGGEQALTATALIFAVFLTNPSPVCVLDEVDAPLDDANVERYCDLLDGMARDTDTRFLVITHNPITMARMDRLYGVTMVERGASQLVSVDLAGAERIREAS